MVKRRKIQAFVNQVVAQFRPQRVILFGSYVYGTATENSDVDLLVVMRHQGHAAVQAAQIRKRIRAGFPMDLVVRSPKAIRRRIGMGDFFLKEILERGQPLYEAKRARVG